MLTIPRLFCLASKNVISALHYGDSWPFTIAKSVEITGTPPVSRGTVNQHEVRTGVLQLFFQPIVDENFLLLSSQDRGILKRQVWWIPKLIHDPTNLIEFGFLK